MKKLLLSAALSSFVLTGYTQTKNYIDQPNLEIAMSADSLVVPDRVFLDINLYESVAEAEANMMGLFARLGIDTDKYLRLSDQASNFKSFVSNRREIVKRKRFELEVSSAQTAGNVMIELEKLDITNVNVTRVELSELEKIREILQVKAAMKARTQAQAMTAVLNQKLGKAIHVTNIGDALQLNTSAPNVVRDVEVVGYLPTASKMGGKVSTAAIEFRKIRVQQSVNVVFALD
ncbi:MAG: SIMPL domain-containing protein [Pedobacter sp.]|nr:MAG: SIMPL domain-containing protein [Pedobacter sp.]